MQYILNVWFKNCDAPLSLIFDNSELRDAAKATLLTGMRMRGNIWSNVSAIIRTDEVRAVSVKDTYAL